MTYEEYFIGHKIYSMPSKAVCVILNEKFEKLYEEHFMLDINFKRGALLAYIKDEGMEEVRRCMEFQINGHRDDANEMYYRDTNSMYIYYNRVLTWMYKHSAYTPNKYIGNVRFDDVLIKLEQEGHILFRKGSLMYNQANIIFRKSFFKLIGVEKTNDIGITTDQKAKKDGSGYDYEFGDIKIKVGEEIIFGAKNSIKNFSNFKGITEQLKSQIKNPQTKLRRAIGMTYAILKSNNEKLDGKIEKLEFEIDENFFELYNEFFDKFDNIIPNGNKKKLNKLPHKDCKIASNYVSDLRDVLAILVKEIEIPNKHEKNDRQHPFEYSLLLSK